MTHSDLNPKIDTSVLHVVLLRSGKTATLVTVAFQGSVDQTLRGMVADRPALLTDLQLAVVIRGNEVRHYQPEMFKWLCGLGPNPDDPNWMGFSARGTGQTTRQMMAAPMEAVYVWCTSDPYYAKHLAVDLGRDDLQIVTPAWLDHEGSVLVRRSVRGLNIMLDHACRLNPSQRQTFEMNEYKRSKRK